MKELDNYYLLQQEPCKSCLMALRTILLQSDPDVTEAWKYRMPFFCFRGKMFCYFWIDPKINQPYIGFVEGKHIRHPSLVTGNRTRMKILVVDPKKDIPIRTIRKILGICLALYKNGTIKINHRTAHHD